MGLDAELVKAVAMEAVKRGCDFFAIPAEWDVSLVMTTDKEEANPASVHCQHDYLTYKVHINAAEYDSLADVWRDAGGHEVGHLVMEEALSLQQLMEQGKDKNAPHLIRALERGTMRLERLFLRQNPYPGDDHFQVEPKS